MHYSFILPFANLPRSAKRLIALSFDAFLCIVTVWLAYALRLEEILRLSDVSPWPVLAALGISLPMFVVTGFYRAIFRYSGWEALMTLARVATCYGLIYATLFTVIGVEGVPRTIGIIQPILLLFAVAVSRSLVRQLVAGLLRGNTNENRISRALVYGAGSAGRQLVEAMQHNPELQIRGYLDDDQKLHNHQINGLTVYNPCDLEKIIPNLRIDTVLIAIPSASRSRRRFIVESFLKFHLKVRTLPGLADLANGCVTVSDLKVVEITDLLGREPIEPDPELLQQNITGKVVLISGAGGSIGSELCRQALALAPARLLMVDQCEYALYTIHVALEAELTKGNEGQVVPILASVSDVRRMEQIFSLWKPDTVYHAAAYKHVPLVEANITEGIRNNVFGTLTLANAAINTGVSDFVMISTDKAVRPTSVMGASKRLAEMLIQSLASKSHTTCFSMVRFGNVLGSSGSVIPRFSQQIINGGPVTLTHKDIIRYFMTIPEAVQLVIQAGAMAKGGEVFVLDMGEPVRIYDLAERMIQLSGLTLKSAENPDGDIEIEITGLRPGEKLYEELLIQGASKTSRHPRIMIAHEPFITSLETRSELILLSQASERNDDISSASQLRRIIDLESTLEPLAA